MVWDLDGTYRIGRRVQSRTLTIQAFRTSTELVDIWLSLPADRKQAVLLSYWAGTRWKEDESQENKS